MAINNNIVTGRPNTTLGLTGKQVTRFIPGVRIFLGTPDSDTAAPVQDYFLKTNGNLAAWAGQGFTDMGVVSGDTKMTYSKTREDVKTGLIVELRDVWISERKFSLEFTLAQMDDIALTTLTGLTPSVIQAGSVINLAIGQETVVRKKLIAVFQSVTEGKEVALYHPNAIVDFTYDYADKGLALKCTADCTPFVAQGQTQEQLISKTIFA